VEKKQILYVINNYMQKKKISKDLQFNIREYLEYYYKEKRLYNSEEENKIIKQLSDCL